MRKMSCCPQCTYRCQMNSMQVRQMQIPHFTNFTTHLCYLNKRSKTRPQKRGLFKSLTEKGSSLGVQENVGAWGVSKQQILGLGVLLSSSVCGTAVVAKSGHSNRVSHDSSSLEQSRGAPPNCLRNRQRKLPQHRVGPAPWWVTLGTGLRRGSLVSSSPVSHLSRQEGSAEQPRIYPINKPQIQQTRLKDCSFMQKSGIGPGQ